MEATYEEAKQIVEDKLINKTEYRTYEELSEILFGEGNCFNESEVRKRMYGMKRMIELHDKYENNSTSNNDVIEIQLAKRELEAAKVQFRDERAAWNRQNTIDARVNQKLDYLESVLKESGERIYTPSPIEVCAGNSDNDLLVILSDLHIGAAFSSEWGEYNPDIATRRLNQYIREIVKIAERHNSENCFVSIQGDLISGNIHKSIQVTNRENAIDQIKIAANLITDFCFELSNYFKKVTITNVSGNHSRIDKKEDAIHSERLDDLIGWIVKNSLSHINKITFKENNLDIGIASIDIRGKEYIAVHGDYDSYSPSGVSNLCMMIHRIPYAILYGHLHHCSVDEVNGVKMVRGGSLAGSGDAFTIEKRLSGKPSQMVCVCSSFGIEAYYPVELN